jgi:hypothetical protein
MFNEFGHISHVQSWKSGKMLIYLELREIAAIVMAGYVNLGN